MPTLFVTILSLLRYIGKHIIAQQALAGRREGIGIDKSADLGIIITALEVIEAGLLVANIAAETILSVRG